MSWHRLPVIHYNDALDNLTSRSVSSQKGALKKPCGQIKDEMKPKNNVLQAFTKGNEYKNKKVCTFKSCEPSPVLHSTLVHHPSCSGDKTRNKRINTEYVLVPQPDIRITKKQNRFTEANEVRSPCSILSLKSKDCQGNPYIVHYPKHSGVCDCQQTEADKSKTKGRYNKNRRRKISTNRCLGVLTKPRNESITYNPNVTTCANAKSKKKLKNKKIGGDTCICYIDATTSTNDKTVWTKTIEPEKRRRCPSKLNTKTCASDDDNCCEYYDKPKATITKNKTGPSRVRPKKDEFQFPDCCQTNCSNRCVDFVDEATETNDNTHCSKIVVPRIPGCQTTRAKAPHCQKLTHDISKYHSKLSKIINETCNEPPECHIEEAAGNNDKSECLKNLVRPECRNKITSTTCTDPIEKDSATDTMEKTGCFKFTRPRIRTCRKHKWYYKLKKKSSVVCDFYKNASTSTKPKSRCSKPKDIRPRIYGCQYSRWNCFGKTKPCTCCVDNAEICKCQQFKWKKMLRRNTKSYITKEDKCGRKIKCQRVNISRAVSPSYGASKQVIENSCQTGLTQAREILIKSTAVTSTTILLEPSKKCDKFDFQTHSSQEICNVHPKSQLTNCGVATSSSLLNALSHKINPSAKCCKPGGKQQCLRCRLSNCLEHLMMGTVAVCCAPCFLVAISYWFVCYLLTYDCKNGDETNRTSRCRDVSFQGGNYNTNQRKCLDPCSSYSMNNDRNLIINTPPGYALEMYNDKATKTACLSNPCTKTTMTFNDEGNTSKKKKKIRISKRCRKNLCPNPRRKYNLYYVDDRGWVMKPIPDGTCGGGDNNLNPDTCSSPKRIICDRVHHDSCCKSTGPICFPQKTSQNPCCNIRDPGKCISAKIFPERASYECSYDNCADYLRPPKEPKKQDPCKNNAEPKTVIFCERATFQDACCSSLDPNCPLQNKINCERVYFQDPCAFDYATSKDRVLRSSQPWWPSNCCICLSDCKCPKISFLKWMFSKSKTRNKSQMHGNEYHQHKKGRSNQKTNIESFYKKTKTGSRDNSFKTGSDNRKSKKRRARTNSPIRKAYRKSKTRMLGFCNQFNRADDKFRSETEAVCQDMVKDIVQLQPTMKQTFCNFSRSSLRIFRYIMVSCCCCPVFFCVYCCHLICYKMYCNVFC